MNPRADLEEDLRRSFTTQASGLPQPGGLADHAIGAARSIRRRRRLTAGVAAIVLLSGTAFAAVSSNLFSGTGNVAPGSSAAPTERPPAATTPRLPDTPVSNLAADGTVSIWLPQRQQAYTARVKGPDVQVKQLASGWLIVPSGADQQTEYVSFDGRTGSLPQKMSYVAVAPDGSRIAWRMGSSMYTGRVEADGALIQDSRTDAPPVGGPLAYNGTVVFVGRDAGAGRVLEPDMWRPADGPFRYTPGSKYYVAVVPEVTPSGEFVALTHNPNPPTPGAYVPSRSPEYGEGMLCMSRLDPSTMNIRSSRCTDLHLPYTAQLRLSPGGRHLGVTIRSDRTGEHQLAVYDIDKAFQSGWAPIRAFTGRYNDLGWEGELSLLVKGPEGLVRLRIDSPDPVPVAVPGFHYLQLIR
ncbi:hypothetical protein [Longispora albida]|uniref:hypothetical protein n=1 Tax=Longispora albida TaxID=203523 RepID=UPI000360061E|nr:hypothetical protein [Longispora albida]